MEGAPPFCWGVEREDGKPGLSGLSWHTAQLGKHEPEAQQVTSGKPGRRKPPVGAEKYPFHHTKPLFHTQGRLKYSKSKMGPEAQKCAACLQNILSVRRQKKGVGRSSLGMRVALFRFPRLFVGGKPTHLGGVKTRHHIFVFTDCGAPTKA